MSINPHLQSSHPGERDKDLPNAEALGLVKTEQLGQLLMGLTDPVDLCVPFNTKVT